MFNIKSKKKKKLFVNYIVLKLKFSKKLNATYLVLDLISYQTLFG